MRSSSSWLFLLALLAVAGCPLPAYPDRVIVCGVGDDDQACPEGFTCLDTDDTDDTAPPAADDDGDTGLRCVKTGCGDGLLDPGSERCDDGNDNEFDLCSNACFARRYDAVTGDVIGLGPGGGAGRLTPMGRPLTIAADPAGNVYASTGGLNVIMRLTPDGNDGFEVAAIAGSGSVLGSFVLDDAVRADQISTPFVTSMTVDSLGNLYVGDIQENTIRRIDAVTGLVEIIAGNGERESNPEDGGDARDFGLDLPVGVTTDGDGFVYFAERGPLGSAHHRIRRIDPETRVVTTVLDDPPNQPPEARPLGGAGINDLAFDTAGRLHALQILVDSPARPGPGDDVLVDQHIVIRTIDPRNGRVQASRRFLVATERRRERPSNTFEVISVETSLPGIGGSQATFSTLDGRDFYVVMGNQIIQLKTEGETARQVALVPDAVSADGDGLFAPGDDGSPSLLAFAFKPTDTALIGDKLFVADPGNGVIWRFDVNERVVADAALHAVAGIAPPPQSVEVVDVVADIAIAFGEESDGHVTVGTSGDCGATNPLDGNAIEFSVAFPDLHRVVFSNCSSSIVVVAGIGRPGRIEQGPARDFPLDTPTALLRIQRFNAAGVEDDAFYVADRDNHRVVRVRNEDPTAPVSRLIGETFIGGGAGTAPGVAGTLELLSPSALAMEESANPADATRPIRRLLIADTGHHRILRVDLDTGEVSTVVGTGTAGHNGDDLPAAATQLDEPTGLVVLPLGLLNTLAELNGDPLPVQLSGSLLIISERSGHRIRGVFSPPIGIFPDVITLAGDGVAGDIDDAIDGTAARLRFPRGLMFAVPDVQQQQLGFLIVDAIDRIRLLTLAFDLGTLTLSTSLLTPAHAGAAGPVPPSRDDGPRDVARFRGPSALTFLDDTRVLVTDRATGRLRVVDVDSGAVVTASGMPDGVVVDAGAAPIEALTAAPLAAPGGVALQDDVSPPIAWVSESAVGRLRRFILHDPAQPSTWETDVGLTDATLVSPEGLAFADGFLYVADAGAHVIFRIDPSDGSRVVVTGVEGRRGAFGEDDAASLALLNEPTGVAVSGTVAVIADTGNQRVRRVDRLDTLDSPDPADIATVITTILGDGEAASAGEGKPANTFPVALPRGIAVDVGGNVAVTSGSALRFIEAGRARADEPTLVANGTDTVRTIYGRAPRDTFPEAVTRCIDGVALSPPQSSLVIIDGVAEQAFARQRIVAIDGCLGTVVPLRRLADEAVSGAVERAAVPPRAAK